MLVNSITILLDHNPTLDVFDSEETTPLGHAIIDIHRRGGSSEIVSLLLRYGADVNFCGPRRQLSPLHIAVDKNREDVVAILIENNADVNALDGGEDTPLIHAVKNHKGSNEMLALLLRHGAIVNYCGPRQKQGPLHVAISSYKADVVAFLLENNADMNALDTSGHTPLLLSLRSLSSARALSIARPIARMLLSHEGADVNKAGNMGQTPLFYCLGSAGENDDLVSLCLERGCAVDHHNSIGQSALHIVKSVPMTRLLLDRGAVVNCRDKDGNTPLHAQILSKNIQVVKILLETTYISTLLNAENMDGDTPLHIAVINDVESVVQMLLEHGASLSAVDKLGRTPQDIAIENSNKKLYPYFNLVEGGEM